MDKTSRKINKEKEDLIDIIHQLDLTNTGTCYDLNVYSKYSCVERT